MVREWPVADRHDVAGALVECVLVNECVRVDAPARASHHDRVSDPAVINTLAICDWVRRGQPLCLIGDSGTGKSHLLIALGTEAAMGDGGHRVKYVLATKLVNELVGAADEMTSPRPSPATATAKRRDYHIIAPQAIFIPTEAVPRPQRSSVNRCLELSGTELFTRTSRPPPTTATT